MWRDYSRDSIRNNRASAISILAASFVAALFLSLLCSLFYNIWLDNIEGTKQEEGDWHGRISGPIGEEELRQIRLYANVESAVVNPELSDGQEIVVDVYFRSVRSIYRDMNALLRLLKLPKESADYHYQLLSLYFVRIPGDEMPRLLMPAYLAVVVLVCISLILVIQNSFAVSMNSRIRQFGILSSIGAAPGQIRVCLLQEACTLALIPVLLGHGLGILLSFCTIRAVSAMAERLAGGRAVSFHWHPAVLMATLTLSLLTILFSAGLPAWKLSRLSPLEAIRGTKELQLTRRAHTPVLSRLFGAEGELAGSALKAQRKALCATSWSLTLSFLGFMLVQCFFTLSGISTRHTYFEAYQDAWDVMVTVKETKIEDFALTEELKSLPGADSSVVYQRAEAVCMLPGEALGRDVQALGGLTGAADGTLRIKAPIVVLDDESFLEYCIQTGTAPRLDGTIVLNRYWDDQNSSFRYPDYVPYIKEDTKALVLQGDAKEEIPVLACALEGPILREEYEKGEHPLVQFLPLSLWKEIGGKLGAAGGDTCIRVLAEDRGSLEALDALEEEIMGIVRREYDAGSENRIREKVDNDRMIRGYQLLLGAFCVMLAAIGIAHVFSHTLGFLRQRRREFARYLSIGLTPGGMCRIFCLEALAVAGRPMLAALALTSAAAAFMIRMSDLDPVEFLREAPVLPIFLFVLAVSLSLALAYYLGGRKMLTVSLSEALRDDTML